MATEEYLKREGGENALARWRQQHDTTAYRMKRLLHGVDVKQLLQQKVGTDDLDRARMLAAVMAGTSSQVSMEQRVFLLELLRSLSGPEE